MIFIDFSFKYKFLNVVKMSWKLRCNSIFIAKFFAVPFSTNIKHLNAKLDERFKDIHFCILDSLYLIH